MPKAARCCRARPRTTPRRSTTRKRSGARWSGASASRWTDAETGETMASMRAAALGAVMIVAGAAPCAAQSNPVADFYKGKTVNVYIGVGVGGEYDLQARLVAKYIGRHIPGNPNVVPQNMTG